MQDDGAVGQDAPVASVADRLLHSDPHDFAGLYIRHRASFTMHARRYLRDARDADEVVQEAFLRLFLALPELETELQALAYCRRTITNLCIDRFRAQARRPSLVDLDSAGAMDLAEDDPGDPVVRAEDAAMVRAALSLLSPLHRAALVKREIEEKPLPVIAQELEIPEESVKHVLFRARRALRRILATTSLAPGSDAEIAGALGKAARSSSGGVAAFILLLFLGLGTGPDLRAIPVVGTDLPDLIPVTEIASAVGDAVVVVADGVSAVVTSPGDAGDTSGEAAAEPDSAEPGVAVVTSPSPRAREAAPAAPPAVPGPVVPSSTPSPAGSASPSPSPSPTASRGPGSEPTDGPESPEPTPPAAPASPSAQPTTASGATSGTTTRRDNAARPSSSPSPSSAPSAASASASSAHDPDAWTTEGVTWTVDPETGELVLVPLDELEPS